MRFAVFATCIDASKACRQIGLTELVFASDLKVGDVVFKPADDVALELL